MDATATTFEDGSFDLAVDKGTFDAITCEAGEEKPLAQALIREMARVVKVGGKLVLVSHASHRQEFITTVAPCWDLEEVMKCDLSANATLVNILRSRLAGAPMSHALKDPELFISAIKEFRQEAAAVETFAQAPSEEAVAAGEAARSPVKAEETD